MEGSRIHKGAANCRADRISLYGDLPLDLVVFASAGGAKYNGAVMQGVFWGKKAMTPDELQQHGALGQGPAETVHGLRAFIESPCMFIDGAEVPRRVLIKYVCNLLGGAHFDPKRDYTSEGRLFRLLDSVGERIKIVDKQAVYLELLSIGQTLAQADDIRMFCEKVTGTDVKALRWDRPHQPTEWHPLTPQQKDQLKRSLGSTKGDISVVYVSGSAPQAFAESLSETLCDAGWSAIPDQFMWAQPLSRVGLRLTAQAPLPSRMDTLRKGLKEIGFTADIAEVTADESPTPRITVGHRPLTEETALL